MIFTFRHDIQDTSAAFEKKMGPSKHLLTLLWYDNIAMSDNIFALMTAI